MPSLRQIVAAIVLLLAAAAIVNRAKPGGVCFGGRTMCTKGCHSCACSHATCGDRCAGGPACHGCWQKP